jgi:hypothetical protein
MQNVVTFDQVEPLLGQIFDEARPGLDGIQRLVAIRDLFGRVRFVVDARPVAGTPLESALQRLAQAAHDRLGSRAFPPDQAFLYGDELASDFEATLETGRMLREGPPEFRLIDRQVTGMAWNTVQEPGEPQGIPRLAFYSLKGGVGRSTAVAVAAWHLAKRGLNVLVLDLDLEAPGLSTSLLPQAGQPELGVVDWFVEDAVGQGDYCLDRMVAASPLAQELPGQIWVVPCHGAEPGDYLAKLGRCYLDLPSRNHAGPERWEERLARMIGGLERIERLEKPHITLLDVRAGLPDLAAVATTDLGAELLPFALDTDQTWAGYRLLLDSWRRSDAVRPLRERLHIVAAQVPETDREPYLSRFREHAWNLLRDYAYDEIEPHNESREDAFSFDLMDENAPHAPIPIYWNRGFASMTHLHALDETLVAAAFGRFLERIGAFVSIDTEARP